MLEQAADPRGADAHDRQAARHCLERREPERFVGTGRDEQIGARIGARQACAIGLEGEHAEHLRPRARRALESAPQMALADEHQPESCRGVDPGEGVEHHA
ncbi:MAG: hypothetical protein DMD25_09610 [Gemmatimonadetes bacterium]|nr:MAG: hypothetical protein DMD25_09610 [Gemmatimonadota bacterium]